MKFTKEDAFKELVKRMTANNEKINLSDRSINEQLETLMPLLVSEETELNDFVDRTLPLFKTANANVRNDISEGIRKYKEENPIQNGNQTTTTTTTTPSGNKELEEMRARLEKMENEYADVKRKEKIDGIRTAVISKLKEKGVKDKNWINALSSEVTITEDFDVDGKVDSYIKLYNQSKAEYNPNATPNTSGGKGSSDDDAIKQAAEIAKANRLVGGI